MHDKGKILTGLIIFLGLVTSPLWYYQSSGKAHNVPDLKYPTDETKCVESKQFMKESHMEMLDEWRDQVVRGGSRIYVASDGREHNMSLSLTCLACHAKKEEFCDQCHNYVAVKPYCWDCHTFPKENS